MKHVLQNVFSIMTVVEGFRGKLEARRVSNAENVQDVEGVSRCFRMGIPNKHSLVVVRLFHNTSCVVL